MGKMLKIFGVILVGSITLAFIRSFCNVSEIGSWWAIAAIHATYILIGMYSERILSKKS